MSVSQANGGTRSGLLWEVERILTELDYEHRPQILLMENVPAILSKDTIQDFQKWRYKLEELGYSSYCEILNAKHYGIAQNRQRAFMISFKGEYAYTFPIKMPLEYKLKDYLDDQVEEKYYLSDKLINCFLSDGTGEYPRGERFIQNLTRQNQDIGNAITTLAENRPTDNFVVENERMIETLKNNKIKDGDFIDTYNRSVKSDVSGVITTRVSASNNTFVARKYNENSIEHIKTNLVKGEIENALTTQTNFTGNGVNLVKIKNATKQGYLEAEIGDGIDISTRMETHRGTVQKGISQTIQTKCDVDVIDSQEHLRIRKLTPCECLKLMGFTRKDHQALVDNGLSDGAIYHCAGDSIVTCCIIAITAELFGKDHREIIKNYVERIIRY